MGTKLKIASGVDAHPNDDNNVKEEKFLVSLY